MNPCYWSPIPVEVQPHGVNYGPDRYIRVIPRETVTEPLHKDVGKEAMPSYKQIKNDDGNDDGNDNGNDDASEDSILEDTAKRPPKPPFASHGHVIWTTFTLSKGSSYTGYVKRDSSGPTQIRHGMGTFSHFNSFRKYFGAWWDDEKHGRGNEIRHDGKATFVGEFRHGLKHGRGTIKYHQTGHVDKGIWKYDKKMKTIMRGNKFVLFDT